MPDKDEEFGGFEGEDDCEMVEYYSIMVEFFGE